MASEQKEQVDEGFDPEQDDLLFVKDELAVTGPKSQIQEALAQLPEGLRLKERHRLDLDPNLFDCMSERVPPILGDRWGCLKQFPWLMDLYQIRDGRSPKEWKEDVSKFDCLFPDLNYLTGYRYTVVGSPRDTSDVGGEVTASRYTVVGSPYTTRGGRVDASDFWDQWAFQRIGLAHVEEGVAARDHKGVEVAIFDTCPFGSQGTHLLDWETPGNRLTGFELMVELVSAPNPPSNPFVSLFPDLGDHGLAVAGLVHAVAPESSIRLFRVLDDQARGNLYGLVAAMGRFVGEMHNRPAAHRNGVINLSLGVHGTSDRDLDPVALLEFMLAYADCLGLVIVAAAGNDSWGKPGPLEAQMPAALDYVVGAQASSVGGARACFSNDGDVGAPGCGLISLAYEPPPRVDYRYWTGTSFAAPLVSGLAARLLDELPGQPSPDQVRQEILGRSGRSSDSTLPNGIISLVGP